MESGMELAIAYLLFVSAAVLVVAGMGKLRY